MENAVVAITIGERNKSEKYVDFFRQNGITLSLGMYGQGTATKETLELLGIGNSEKFVIFSFMTLDQSKEVLKKLEIIMQMKKIGVGISFTVPMESIDGMHTLKKLISGIDVDKEGEGYELETETQLLVIIANRGYTETVMDVARSAGAQGGTVVHARGTSTEDAQKFFGTLIGAEKEMIFIVTKKDTTQNIMKAIKEQVGVNTPSGAISFSLPVCDTAGMIEY
ncbi:MAG: P-II family nitrogen regulator [Clostridia bacterium]|nr:P-II family nitrogen regulator [Clostridia bacterium]